MGENRSTIESITYNRWKTFFRNRKKNATSNRMTNERMRRAIGGESEVQRDSETISLRDNNIQVTHCSQPRNEYIRFCQCVVVMQNTLFQLIYVLREHRSHKSSSFFFFFFFDTFVFCVHRNSFFFLAHTHTHTFSFFVSRTTLLVSLFFSHYHRSKCSGCLHFFMSRFKYANVPIELSALV